MIIAKPIETDLFIDEEYEVIESKNMMGNAMIKLKGVGGWVNSEDFYLFHRN